MGAWRSLRHRLDILAGLAKVEKILREDASITMLVNNAGVGAIMPLLDTDVNKMDELIAVNVAALTRLTYAAAPAFVSRGAGTIVNISSVVGIAPEMLNGVYGASKAFVTALSQSLQHELAPKGLRIQAVLPAATATEFWELAGTPVSQLPQHIVMTAENLVDAALEKSEEFEASAEELAKQEGRGAKPSIGTSHEQIVADVAGFVAELQRQGLLSEYNR